MTKNDFKDIFVFTDIHGQALELRLLLEHLPITEKSMLVFLGDYIDRGDNSKEVIDIILELKITNKVIALTGNHEEMLLSFLQNSSSTLAGSFIFNGGNATLASYSDTIDGEFSIPQDHLDFFNNLDIFYETDEYFFVHAGVPDIPLKDIDKDKNKDDLLWIRKDFINSNFKWDKLIVHGHTPVKKAEEHDHRINIDTGCFFNGMLTALQLPEKKYFAVKKQTEFKHLFLKKDDSSRKSVRFSGEIEVEISGKRYSTINYSEFGLLFKGDSCDQIYSVGNKLSGSIAGNYQETLKFEAVVVRVLKDDDKFNYAIQFLISPLFSASSQSSK